MTTLVALMADDGVWIGSDTRMSAGNIIMPCEANKWVTGQFPDHAIATGGCAYTGEIIARRFLQACDAVEKVDAFRVMEDVRKAVRDAGEYRQRGEDEKCDCSGLLVWRKKLYDFSGTLWPSPIAPGVLWARGSGMDFAIGAGHALKDSPPRVRIERALETACVFDGASAPPFFISKIGWPV